MENITLNIKEMETETEIIKNVVNNLIGEVIKKDTFNVSTEKEVIRFYYFSELGLCGDDLNKHQEYCNKMISHGYTLIKITPLGNLDSHRDSYEGTLIYHWKLKTLE